MLPASQAVEANENVVLRIAVDVEKRPADPKAVESSIILEFSPLCLIAQRKTTSFDSRKERLPREDLPVVE